MFYGREFYRKCLFDNYQDQDAEEFWTNMSNHIDMLEELAERGFNHFKTLFDFRTRLSCHMSHFSCYEDNDTISRRLTKEGYDGTFDFEYILNVDLGELSTDEDILLVSIYTFLFSQYIVSITQEYFDNEYYNSDEDTLFSEIINDDRAKKFFDL